MSNMKTNKIFIALALLGSVVIGATSSETHAGVILDVSDGQLRGARNIDVRGTLYDVRFVEGTCVALFSGCDEDSDFTFQTLIEGNQAADALLNQVFTDSSEGMFDTIPELTLGCEATTKCQLLFPYEAGTSRQYRQIRVNNGGRGTSNGFQDLFANPSFDTSGDPDEVFVIFTRSIAIPEPSTLILFATGLAGLTLIGRRHRLK